MQNQYQDCEYKLVMFGLSALCQDLDEVKRRLALYPKERYTQENGDECYLVRRSSGEIYPIAIQSEKFVIQFDR